MDVNLILLGPGFVRVHVDRPAQLRRPLLSALDCSGVTCLHRDITGAVCGRFTKVNEAPSATGFVCPLHQTDIHVSRSEVLEEVDYIPRLGPVRLDPAYEYIRVEAR